MHRVFDEGLGVALESAEFLYMPCLHLSVTVDPVTFESFKLTGPCADDPRPDIFRLFACVFCREVLIGDRGDLDMNIDPVKKGIQYPSSVAVYLAGRAGTLVPGVRKVSAGAGVHGGHKHERCWIGDRCHGP